MQTIPETRYRHIARAFDTEHDAYAFGWAAWHSRTGRPTKKGLELALRLDTATLRRLCNERGIFLSTVK